MSTPAVVLVLGTLAGSIHVIEPDIYWGATVEKCMRVAPLQCELIGPQEDLTIQLGIANGEKERIRVPPLATEAAVELVNSRLLDVTQTWHPSNEKSGMVGALEELDIEPGGGRRLRLRMASKGGEPFPPGEYELRINLSGALGKTTSESGRLWQGRTISSQTWRVRIRAIESRADTINYHSLEARYLIGQGRHDAALKHLSVWRSLVGGSHPEASFYLGVALVSLNRFAESIPPLEVAWRAAAEAGDAVQKRRASGPLAAARVGIGDLAGAAEVLRAAGVSEADIKLRVGRPKD